MTVYQESVKSCGLNLREGGLRLSYELGATGSNTYNVNCQFMDWQGNNLKYSTPFIAYLSTASGSAVPASLSGGAADQSAFLSLATGYLTFDDQADYCLIHGLTNANGLAVVTVGYTATGSFYLNIIDCDGIHSQFTSAVTL